MRRCCTCKGHRAGAGERKSPPVTFPGAHNIPKFPPSSQQQPPSSCLPVGIAVCAPQHGPPCCNAGLGAGRWACSLGMSVVERWIVPDTWLLPLLIFSPLSLSSATSLFTGHPKPGWACSRQLLILNRPSAFTHEISISPHSWRLAPPCTTPLCTQGLLIKSSGGSEPHPNPPHPPATQESVLVDLGWPWH